MTLNKSGYFKGTALLATLAAVTVLFSVHGVFLDTSFPVETFSEQGVFVDMARPIPHYFDKRANNTALNLYADDMAMRGGLEKLLDMNSTQIVKLAKIGYSYQMYTLTPGMLYKLAVVEGSC